jgi:hypothetical protein
MGIVVVTVGLYEAMEVFDRQSALRFGGDFLFGAPAISS